MDVGRSRPPTTTEGTGVLELLHKKGVVITVALVLVGLLAAGVFLSVF